MEIGKERETEREREREREREYRKGGKKERGNIIYEKLTHP